MTIERMEKVIEILKNQVKPNAYFDSDHDIIYIPWFEKKGDVAEKLEKTGCHWNIAAGSWASY